MESLLPLIQGDAVAPLVLASKLQGRFMRLGPQGFTGIAMAAIDMAAWDVLAKSAGLSLSRLLDGEEKPIPAYHSLGMAGPEGAAQEAAESSGLGFRCVKFKVGYPHVEQDRAVVRAARSAAGKDLQVMVDYNQSLSVPEAIRRVQLLDEEALVWVEEPTRADDLAGHARIAAECRTPIQIGESFWGPHDLAKSLSAGASDFVMLDVMNVTLRIIWHRILCASWHNRDLFANALWTNWHRWINPLVKSLLSVFKSFSPV